MIFPPSLSYTQQGLPGNKPFPAGLALFYLVKGRAPALLRQGGFLLRRGHIGAVEPLEEGGHLGPGGGAGGV